MTMPMSDTFLVGVKVFLPRANNGSAHLVTLLTG